MSERRAAYRTHTPRKLAKLRQIAYHEAGHVLIAHAEGLATQVVCLGRDDDGRPKGWTDYPTGDYQRVARRPGAALRIEFAGVAAGLRASGAKLPARFWDGASGDLRGAWKIARHARRGSAARLALLLRQWAKVQRLLDDHWPAVERLAGALMATGRLDRREIASLLGEQTFGSAGADHPQQAQP